MRWLILFALAAVAFAEDPVAALCGKNFELPFDSTTGYLPALLAALHVPVESQMAVFSKTSIQGMRIEPANPRLLYFNDEVTVGWVRGGFIELAALDPGRGMRYYTLQQRPAEHITPREDCVNCHKSGSALVRSVETSPDGIPLRDIDPPWGGWFVTGSASFSHAGNTASKRELTPSATSDIVALTVFAHQMRVANLLVHPDDPNKLADELLFVDEDPFEGPIRGSSGFAEKFSAAGPRDRRSRSLRDLDLNHHLMRYPCSYMIYSPSFDALAPRVKEAVYRRMWSVLSTRDPAVRKATVEILLDTKPGLPAYFHN